MNKLKEQLIIAFDTPKPRNKSKFISELALPKITISEFLFSQIHYISKGVWCIFISFFILSILGCTFLPDVFIWFISGLTPFLAITITSESGRSELYGMAELEMTTRFCLKSIIYARLTIIGIICLLLINIIALLGLLKTDFTFFTTSIYIFTPFLLTTFIGLSITRKIRGPESLYICGGISITISILLFLSHYMTSIIYQDNYIMAWSIILLLLIYGNYKQIIYLKIQTEELSCTLS